MIRFVVPGHPVPAPRMTTRQVRMAVGGRGRNAERLAKYWAWKDAVGWEAKKAGVRPMPGPVAVEATVYVAGRVGDWDNYGKSVCDALIGIAYEDDRQVIEGRVRVVRSRKSEERVEITIRPASEVA